MANITRTFLRSDAMMTKYMKVMREREEKGIQYNPFKETPIKEFNHWVIIDNQFPYDAVATTTHMLATKREIPFSWELLTSEEREEFEQIKKDYLTKNYDAIWENLPKGQTMPGHFHLNLIILKREEI